MLDYQRRQLENGRLGGAKFSVLMILYIIFSLLIQGVALAVFGENTTGYYLCSSFSLVFAIITTLLIFRANDNCKFTQLFSLNKFSPLYILLSLFLALGMLFGFGFINTLFINLLNGIGLKVSSPKFEINNLETYIAYCITLCMFPAVFEELFFRGALLKSLDKTKKPVAVITVALCFSLYHGSFSQFVYQMIYGALLCVLALKSGSIIPSMLAHLLNNLIVLTVEYFGLKLDLFNPIIILCGFLLLAVFILCVLFIDKNKTEEEHDYIKGEVKEFIFPYGLFGIFICLLLIIMGAFL